jgi:hypothetical protein
MEALKTHFFKLVVTILVSCVAYAGQSFVVSKHEVAMLHISYIKKDLGEIKDLLRELIRKREK